MKTRTVLMVGGLVLAAGLGGWWWQQGQTPVVSWRTAELTRQDVRATVSSTGTLAAVTTVEVGTQVSGTIVALFADFNGHVTEGQVIARIDTSSTMTCGAMAMQALAARRLAYSSAMLAPSECPNNTGAGAANSFSNAGKTSQASRCR